MKTLVAALLLTATLLASAPVAAAPPVQASGARTFLVGFAQDTMDNDWRSAQVRELQQAFAAHPEIRFVFTNAHGQTAQQVRDVEDLAAQGVDLLMTSPRDGLAMAPAIGAVHRGGLPVVLLTRRIPGEAFTSFIAPDDAAIGAQAADLLAQALGGTGRILVFRGVPTATTAVERSRGFEQALERYPGLRIAAVRTGNYLRADALHEMERVLAQGIPFDAIFSQSDSMAVGIRLALRGAGIDPGSIPLVGIDYIPEAREAIRRGEQLASFTYPTCGREGAAQAVRILTGAPFEREVTVASVVVTAENVDDVEPIF